jgi:hypothetical protein
MADNNLVIGVVGMVLLLTAFALNLLRKLTHDSVTYIVLNILGAGISTYYAYTLDAYPFIMLEATWALFAIYKLAVVFSRNR